jgi:O-antigen/teichoic acid export membrane protein
MTFARRVLSGTSYLTLSNGFVRMFSIITMPILTRLLSPKAYGVTSLVGTVISLAAVFALAGLDVSYARAYHSAKPPNGAVVEHYCWRHALAAGLLSAVIVATGWWYVYSNSTEVASGLAVLVALGIVSSVANAMALTRARLAGRYVVMARTTIITGITTLLVGIGIAVWWRQDALALLIPMVLSYLVPVLLLGTPSIAGLVRPSTLQRKDGLSLVGIGLGAIVTAPMYWLLSSSDRWFLQHYDGTASVGIYSLGCTVALTGMMVNSAIMSVWIPEASREFENDSSKARDILGSLMTRLIALMAILWLVVASSGADILRWLANKRFHAAGDIVPYIAGGVFFYGIVHLSMTGLLLVKKFNWAVLWWLVGGLFSGLLNLALVPRYGGVGAAITQCSSFAFISIGMLVTSQTLFRMHLDWSRLSAVLGIVVCAGAAMVPQWHASAPASLVMKLPVGIVVAGLVAWLIARDWFVRAVAYVNVSCRVVT